MSSEILNDGPIVEDTNIVRTYLPLAAGGLAWTMAWMKVCRLSTSLASGEGDLAHRRVDDARLVDPELDLAGLGLLDGLADVEGDRARLGVGHEALGAQDPAELADAAHDVGRGDDDVEVDPAAGDLLDDVVAAEVVGPGLLGLLDLLAGGDDADLLGLARCRGAGRRCRGPSGRSTWG